MAEQPYFARVNNRTVVAPGEVAYLPCRVKSSQEGYMVSVQIYLHISIGGLHGQCPDISTYLQKGYMVSV